VLAIKRALSAMLEVSNARTQRAGAGIILTSGQNVGALDEHRRSEPTVVDKMNGVRLCIGGSSSSEKGNENKSSLEDRRGH